MKFKTAFHKNNSGIGFMVVENHKIWDDGVEVEFEEERGLSYVAAGHLELADEGAAVRTKAQINKQEVKAQEKKE